MASRGIYIPCCWSGCSHESLAVDNLVAHVRSIHKVSEGDFGCSECGFIANNITQVQNHLLERHGIREKPKKARLAFAHFCRNQLISSDPSWKSVKKSAFWERGGRKYTMKDQVQGHCSMCNQIVTPWSPKNLQRHYSESHQIVVDIDFEQLHERHQRYNFEERGRQRPNMENTTSDLSDSDGEDDYFDDDDLIGDGSLDSSNACDVLRETFDEDKCTDFNDGDNNDQKSCHELARHSQSSDAPQPTQLSGQDVLKCVQTHNLKQIFLDCVKDTCHEQVDGAFRAYHLRSVARKDYLVNRDQPQQCNPGSSEAPCAFRTPSGWRCEVPHCGAILNDEFAMKLHLYAHGDLENWYCGDRNCRIKYREKPFHDRRSLDQHLAQVHGSSPQSHTAVRRVPEQEVFATLLTDILKLQMSNEHNPEGHNDDEPTTGSSLDHFINRMDLGQAELDLLHALKLALTHATDDTCYDALDIEMTAWQNYCRIECSNNPLTTNRDVWSKSPESDEISKIFEQHCQNSHIVLLRSPQTVSLPPLLNPSKIWVAMLTGVIEMDRPEAMKYILSYRALCDTISVESVETLLRCLEMQIKEHRTSLTTPDTNRPGQTNNTNKFDCPWPNCDHKAGLPERTCHHFLTVHLNCTWQCPEIGCEHCGYRNFRALERHRIGCHVGNLLQCGHMDCTKTFISQLSSRGHSSRARLRKHYENVFNTALKRSQDNESLNTNALLLGKSIKPQQNLLSQTACNETFKGKSNHYLNFNRLQERYASNYRLLKKHGFQDQQVQVRGQKICTGFAIDGQSFKCVDSVQLGLSTSMLIFVPTFMLYTVAPTCDYCIYIMSCISRCYAEIPAPFCFIPKSLIRETQKQVGSYQRIADHDSLRDFASKNHIPLPPMALKYKDMQKEPKSVFIVDFETIRRSKKELPLWPIEVTFRYGDGSVVVSCVINETGVTNTAFEERMRQSGFEDPRSFQAVRRIRGGQGDQIPQNAMTPRQVLNKVVKAGLNPQSFWVEYSTTNFDRHCMVRLIELAGKDVDSILPPPALCWTVIADLWRSLPGK